MSTQCFMSRIGRSPGRFIFAMLLGALLALSCLLPTAAFARAGGQTEAHSLSLSPAIPTAVLAKVGVSVVRLIANYGTGSDQLTCTGLGTLIASQDPSETSPHYTNWVLTDSSLVSTQVNDCGKIGDTLQLNSIQIWASNGYTNGSTMQLGSLTCNDGSARCTDLFSPTFFDSIYPSLPNSSGPYTLLSFESAAGEPYVGLLPSTSGTQNIPLPWNIGLTNSSGGVYLSKNISAVTDPGTDFKNYLTPNAVSSPPAASAGTSKVATPNAANVIEGGTPEINSQGQFVGIWTDSGDTQLSAGALSSIAPIIGQSLSATPTVPGQTCTTVATCWNAGINAYYQLPATQATYTQAHEDLSKVTTLNPQFIAAQHFATLAQQLPVVATKTSRVTPTPTVTVTATPASRVLRIVNQYQWQLIGAGVIVLILLLIVLVLIVRARKHRRALAQFDAEVAESRRIATEQEAQRQRAQQQVAQATCPNCHNAVQVTDAICPYCRFPLAPTASGMGVRLMGNTPVGASPLPPSPVLISEQPTVLFPPHPPSVPSAKPSELIMKHQQAQAYEDATQEIQHVHGRNLSLAVGTRSDPGIKRKHKPNEDSLFAMQGARTHNSSPQQFGLFVVADGMGGHANGQDASRLAIQTMIDFMLPQVSNGEQMDDEAFLKLMGDGVQTSNQAVYNSNLEAHADMGTTMTAALIIGSMAYVANVGDSRTYLYREGQGLSKVTHDHSVVASLVDAGIIKPDDVYTHPKRNQIYRSLGEKQVVEVDTFPVNLLPGDKLLLCSDGLWDMVRDPLIHDVLAKPAEDPNETGQKLIKAALNGGGEDNVSVIVVQFAEMNAHTGMTGVQLLAKPESVTVPNLPPL